MENIIGGICVRCQDEASRGLENPNPVGRSGAGRVVIGEVEASQIGVEKPDDHGFIIKKNGGLIYTGQQISEI
jgi:hypothetical protein